MTQSECKEPVKASFDALDRRVTSLENRMDA